MPERRVGRGRGSLERSYLVEREETDVGLDTVIGVVETAGQAYSTYQRLAAGGGRQSALQPIPRGSDIDIVAGGAGGGEPGGDICAPGYHIAIDKCSGQMVCRKNRKRRKKMLTCSDKVDISFLTGVLGKGANGQAAIQALLARCG